MAIGKITKCMEVVYLHGLTVDSTMESILTTKNQVKEFLFGQMVEDTRDNGKKENNTVKVHT